MDSEGEKKPLLRDGVQDSLPDEQLSGCGATVCCDPNRPVHKYLVLILMCFLSFGSYFCYDNPAAMQDTMLADLDINTSTFMGFYSWYSWPNVIICFFGGFLIDRLLGVRLGAIVFASFVTVGQVVFATGAYLNHVWLMDAGRFIFGVGGESLAVAQNTYAVCWFKEKELNMVFGLQLSMARIGSTVNMNVMQSLYAKVKDTFNLPGSENLGISLYIAVLTCIFSLICALYLGYLDKRASRILKRDAGETGEVINIKDVKDFPAGVWICCVICVAYYVAVFPFIGLGLVFFEMKFDFDPYLANAVNSIVYIISAGASPLFGFIIDKTGKNVFWVMLGTLITLGCHALLAFTFINPFVAMSIMGLSYSILASALWPLVARLVPEYQLGTAYGIMQSVQNLGLGSISLIAGLIVDNSGYLLLEVFFMAWLCVALIFGAVLYILDAMRGGKLNMSSSERNKLKMVKELESRVEEEKGQ